MKKISTISSIIFSLFLVFSCDNPAEEVQPEVQDELSRRSELYKSSKVTGLIQIAFKGKGGKGTVEDKYVFASFAAHDSALKSSKRRFSPAKGFFLFTVFKSDFSPERKIMAQVIDVGFGNQDENISDLGCDIFVAGTHKWIFGPRGTGLAWARKTVWHMEYPL